LAQAVLKKLTKEFKSFFEIVIMVLSLSNFY